MYRERHTLCMLGIFLTLLLSSADSFAINLFKSFFKEHYQSIEMLRLTSGPTILGNLCSEGTVKFQPKGQSIQWETW